MVAAAPPRLLPAAALAVILAAPLSAQDDAPPAEPPRSAGEVTVVPDVVYGHKAGMALTYDVLRPAERNGAGVLFMVSGGWGSRWFPPEAAKDRGLFRELLNRGFTVFLVRHGSAPRFKVPEAVADVRRAVRHVRLNAETTGIDPDRLGVTGGSAGGHLSLMLGTASDDGDPDAPAWDAVARTSDRVAAVVALFPPVDLREIVGPNERFKALEFDPAEAAGVSPITFVTPDDAPALLIHGDRDRLVKLDNSERIAAEFEKAGVESELVVIEGAGHGFRGADNDRVTNLTIDWFEKHLAPGDPPAGPDAGAGE